MTRALRVVSTLVLLLAGLLLPSVSAAEPLTLEERAQLAQGRVVGRPLDAEIGDNEYHGGIAYALVDAPPDAVWEVLLDVNAYRQILPLTQEATEIARTEQERLVYFRHGSSIGSGAYTCRLQPGKNRTIRFWLDPSAPHDFVDAFGFFRVEDAGDGRSLVTTAVLLDLGFGVTRLLFEDRIQRRVLTTPGLIKTYAEARRREALARSPSPS